MYCRKDDDHILILLIATIFILTDKNNLTDSFNENDEFSLKNKYKIKMLAQPIQNK